MNRFLWLRHPTASSRATLILKGPRRRFEISDERRRRGLLNGGLICVASAHFDLWQCLGLLG